MERIENIIDILLIPILPSLAILIGLYIQKLIKKAQADLQITNDSIVALRIGEATNAVVNAIQHTTQTYVEFMKDKGAFDEKAQVEALNLAKERARIMMSDLVQKTVVDVSGDLDLWLKTMIESKIKELKAMEVSSCEPIEKKAPEVL